MRFIGCKHQAVALLAAIVLAIVLQVRPAAAEDPDLLSFSGGYYDIYHRIDPAAEGSIEYRNSRRFWIFKTFGGLMANSDYTGYAYAGVLIDLYFGQHIVLTPSFAPGLWLKGHGKDLGYPLEFRSQIELAWRFADHSRIAISYSHMSNGGLGDRNPGVETAALSYIVPFNKLFGP
ncbi:MAG TPA: acyloxyacyl hydrolase [Candidatus Sulfotelmatobacter sp.]|nr:acyloxyacyl hydrolase [Candidatus Sulfotelmatobacter sp.]